MNLPDGWKKEELRDLGELITGNTPSKKDKKNYLNGTIEFIKPADIQNKSISSFSEKISEYARKVARIVNDGVILVTCIGELGRVGLARKEIAFNQQINAIILNKKINSKFLFYRLQIEKNQLEKISSATTVTIVNKTKFGKIMITYPESKKEQKLIVEEIEKQFTSLDASIKTFKTIKKKLGIYRKSVLKAAFSGEFTQKNTKKINATTNDKNLKLWSIPHNWTWKTMDDISEVKGGSTPKTTVSSYWNGDIKWITPYDLSKLKDIYIYKGRKNITKKGFSSTSVHFLPKGSIVFSSRAPIGYMAIAGNDLCTNQGCKNFILNKSVESKYVYYYLKLGKDFAEKLGSGTTFKEISGKRAKFIPIPLPNNLNEQSEIVQEIESRFSIIDKLEGMVDNALKKSEQLRKSILKSAFEGKLVKYREDSN